MASAARAELLDALEARGISRIQAAMAGYADAVQGVQLQAAAFELLARVALIKEAELDTLIAEMRVLATRRRATAIAATAEAVAEAGVANEATASTEPCDAAHEVTPGDGTHRPNEDVTEWGGATGHGFEQLHALGSPPPPVPPPAAAVPSPSGSPAAAAPARAMATSPSPAAVGATSAAPVTPASATEPAPAADPTPAAEPTSAAAAAAEPTATHASAHAADALPLAPPPQLALMSRKPPAASSLSCMSPGSMWLLSQENQGAQKRAQHAQQAC